MKRILISTLIITFFAFITAPALAVSSGNDRNAGDPVEKLSRSEVKEMSKEESKERVQVLTERLKEIKSMDLDNMKWNERRKLKKEVRGIEKELKWQQNDAGIYISGSALLIIILLIILL